MNETLDTILAPADPPAFKVVNENGAAPVLSIADHAGRRVPRRLGQLGLTDADCARHIAWDISAGAVADRIGQALDAIVIRQNYSRLIIDCNRTPLTVTSIADVSELTPVPGNSGLRAGHKAGRRRQIFAPYP